MIEPTSLLLGLEGLGVLTVAVGAVDAVVAGADASDVAKALSA